MLDGVTAVSRNPTNNGYGLESNLFAHGTNAPQNVAILLTMDMGWNRKRNTPTKRGAIGRNPTNNGYGLESDANGQMWYMHSCRNPTNNGYGLE